MEVSGLNWTPIGAWFCSNLDGWGDGGEEKPEISAYNTVNGHWDDVEINGAKLQNSGYATYRLLIKLPDDREMKGLAIPTFFNAYRIWINGKLLLSNGRVDKNPDKVVPRRSINTVLFFPSGEVTEIILQASNVNPVVGFKDNIKIGNGAVIRRNKILVISYDLFVFGALFLISLYHFGLFILRKKDKFLLFFALFSIIFAVLKIFLWSVISSTLNLFSNAFLSRSRIYFSSRLI